MNVDIIKRTVVFLFLIGLLATPFLIKQVELAQTETADGIDKTKAMERYGFYLEEASQEMGILFEHKMPELDPKLNHILPQIASIGASVAVSDFNNDGYQDLYLTNSRYGTRNALYKNRGDGTFEDVASKTGVADMNKEGEGVSMGAIWGDINNDGFEDLFVYKWGKPELFLNREGETFENVTAQAGLPKWLNANTAVFFDYDNDGLLDLFIGGYYDEKVDFWNLESTKIMPDSYEYATNGGRNYLLKNLGDGTFKDITEELGLTSRRWTLAAAAADLNSSGYPDLVIANDYGVDEFYINEEGKSFRNIGGEAGMGFTPKSGMSVSFADILNQGKFSIYITNISEPGVLVQGNNLWVPSGTRPNGDPSYSNLAGNFGVELGGWSYSGQFSDLNNDGFQDLYVANGYVSAERGTDYWYDYSKISGGNKAIIEDAKNWPEMKGRSLSGYQQNRIWLNDGAGNFREVSALTGGFLELDSRAVAFADLNNNGSLDVIVANQNREITVYKNSVTGGNNWIAFKLEGAESNRSAIGAVAELHWNGQKQAQVVTSASAFSAQNQRPLHFGLGTSASPEKLIIRWPSGIVQEIENPEPGKIHHIVEQKSGSGEKS